MTDLMTILGSLQDQGVDTSAEMLLLRQREKAGEQPVLLVAGDEPGQPLDLLRGLGIAPLCPAGQFLPYPVQCVYGDALTLTATDSRGERHHFYDIPSFLAHGGGDVKKLTVTSDAPVLRRAGLRIITVTEDTLADLGRLAGDCSGVILTLDSSAGAPEPAVGSLCQWLRDAAGLEGSVCLLLNHTETGAVNWMLESMLDVEPVETVPCDYTAAPGSAKHPAGALAAAMDALPGGDAGAFGAQAQCAAAALGKLKARRSRLEEEAGQKRKDAKWFYNSADVFRAKMQIACTAMTISLNEEQKALLNANVNGLKERLKAELPGMAAELVAQNGSQAKSDALNLAGDYVEALCNSYMEFATRYLADRLFRPQAEAVFLEATEGYRTLVRQAPIPVAQWTSERDTEILKTIQVGHVDPKGPLAETLGNVFVLAFGLALDEYLGGFAFTLGRKLEQFISSLAIKAIPTKALVNHFIRDRLIPKLDDLMPTMYKALDETILPQVSSDIRASFQDMIGRSCAVLEEQGGALIQQADDLTGRMQALDDISAQLEAYTL